MPNRLKSYPLWVAFFALIGLIVNDAGLLAPEEYQKYVDAIFAVLIAAGILVNPSSGTGFSDKEEK